MAASLLAVSPVNTPGGYILTFAFPMVLFLVIAAILWALFAGWDWPVSRRFRPPWVHRFQTAISEATEAAPAAVTTRRQGGGGAAAAQAPETGAGTGAQADSGAAAAANPEQEPAQGAAGDTAADPEASGAQAPPAGPDPGSDDAQ